MLREEVSGRKAKIIAKARLLENSTQENSTQENSTQENSKHENSTQKTQHILSIY